MFRISVFGVLTLASQLGVAHPNDSCTSKELAEEFVRGKEVERRVDGGGTVFELRVPTKMHGVALTSVTLERVDNGERTMRALVPTFEVVEHPGRSIAWVWFTSSQVNRYRFIAQYGVEQVYLLDGCTYSFTVASET